MDELHRASFVENTAYDLLSIPSSQDHRTGLGTLYGLTNLILQHRWLSLLNDKTARPHEDSGFEVFQLLVSGFEFHLDD